MTDQPAQDSTTYSNAPTPATGNQTQGVRPIATVSPAVKSAVRNRLRASFNAHGNLQLGGKNQLVTVDEQLAVAEKVISELEQSSLQQPAQAVQQQVAAQPVQTHQVSQPTQPAAQTSQTVSTTTMPQPHFNHVGTPAGMIAQAVPQAVDQVAHQAQMQYQPAGPTATLKEAVVTANPDTQAFDAGTGIQMVEHEASPEIPPEVEAYIKKAEQHSDQLPQEISLAGDEIELTPTKLPKQPVIVLPITEELDKAGGRKTTKHSLRWLVEWSRKIMKIFSGKVVYRE